VPIPAGDTYTVDTGHIVASDSHLSYQVTKAGNWKSTIFGGQGFVCKFSGGGDVYLQTRSPEAFLGWLLCTSGGMTASGAATTSTADGRSSRAASPLRARATTPPATATTSTSR